MKNFLMTCAVLFNSLNVYVPAYAHKSTPAKIQGAEINLSEKDHAFAGTILGSPTFGVFGEESFSAKVQVFHHGQTLNFKLENSYNHYSGVLTEAQKDSRTGEIKSTSTQIEFQKIERIGSKEAKIHLNLDGTPIQVLVAGQSFTNNHFQQPKFSAQIGDKLVQFEFTGQSCFGYSTNLAMMILGTYAHLLK